MFAFTGVWPPCHGFRHFRFSTIPLFLSTLSAIILTLPLDTTAFRFAILRQGFYCD